MSDDSCAYYTDTTSNSSGQLHSSDDGISEELDNPSDVQSEFEEPSAPSVPVQPKRRRETKRQKKIYLIAPKQIIYGHKKNAKDCHHCTCLMSQSGYDDKWLIDRIEAVRSHIRCNVTDEFCGEPYMAFMRTIFKGKYEDIFTLMCYSNY